MDEAQALGCHSRLGYRAGARAGRAARPPADLGERRLELGGARRAAELGAGGVGQVVQDRHLPGSTMKGFQRMETGPCWAATAASNDFLPTPAA